MLEKTAKTLPILIGLIALTQTLPWLLERWFYSAVGYVGAFLFCVGIFYWSRSKTAFQTRKSISLPFLILSIGLFSTVFFTDYNILKILFTFWGIIFGIAAYVKVTKNKFQLMLLWSFLSLPVIPLLGSTLGLLNRIFYLKGIEWVMNPAKTVGTALYDGGYQFSIDSGCSGVLGLYLIACFWCVYTLQKNKILFPELLLTLSVFFGLNSLRVFTIYIIHNKLNYTNLDGLDLALGLIFFTLSLIFLYRRLERASQNYEF